MITDKHLFSELIYVGPKALVALKNSLSDRIGHEAFEDEEGHPWVGEEILADMLIGLAAAGRLRITVIASNDSKPIKPYVVADECIGSMGERIPAKHAELIETLRRRACIYATIINESKATEASH